MHIIEQISVFIYFFSLHLCAVKCTDNSVSFDTQTCITETIIKIQSRCWQIFSVKVQIVTILDFVGYRVSVAMTQLCYCMHYNSYKQYVKEQAWLCSSITLFIKTGNVPVLACRLQLPHLIQNTAITAESFFMPLPSQCLPHPPSRPPLIFFTIDQLCLFQTFI